MKEEIIKIVGNNLDTLGIVIDDAYTEKEGKNTYLRIVLDSDRILNIDEVVEATKIIDPLIEKNDLIKEEYILDVYAKSKGDN